MLSGERNAGERWKTTRGLITKKSNFARAAHFFCRFLFRCFVRLQRETSRNFLVTRFMEEFVVRVLVHLFFTSTHFHLALVAASISHFVTAAKNLSCCSSNKKMFPLFFFSRSRSLYMSPFFSLSFAFPSAYFLFFSVFLLLYILNLWTWQLI